MTIVRKPQWLQKKINPAAHAGMEGLLGELRLHTVCQEARCPNITECFRERQATFLILGAACTRLCSFCNVTKQTPIPPDPGEPDRVAEAIRRLGLSHVVITSPTRDDLPDGGAGHYAETVAAIRSASPATTVELLIPDYLGNRESLARVVASAPAIIGHNVETVPRLYQIRAGADYGRSLGVLRTLRELDPVVRSKSGIMLGLGEAEEEVLAVFADLRSVGCSYLSIGQYLAPSKSHHPVREFIPPECFERYRAAALATGFAHVESGPYVRSSYHAARYDGQL
ncbi:lipoic acid synthetase [Geobacter metallireducens RCH3]|uniref:Lipoyl synthase n=1 Tax=Geobacter metallireducens (strain ATCC 53774 / DSM 7210 / GS-15) TaxID=269799 RepID=LIPA_GEOMG|nr:lipoyl synthase [Geobacter metallireducens]Q39QW1.1 RecName: Full=Lipoyl synthase; AltName: Full=Lip-syn; Short=LS; AltName: Full=Lipoate synthase; AltName: Full=Lipoic acid synthase; AltName: Full=Sulfur insertion protein LipA [Geobacter metallireducens GS-15]ABB33363.1 lipoate synthase [Geobacter metallireducens GS-15]EHP85428.1 lipoic acid synthetase [Geobacter metallireducens RCH3]